MDILTTLNTLSHDRTDEIAAWFDKAYRLRQVPIYSSVDVRHAGFKVAPVDTNLFPAGFNNLTDAGKDRAAQAFQAYMDALSYSVQRVLIMSESHTRNQPYFDNVQVIMDMCEAAGLEVALGRFDLSEEETSIELQRTDGGTIRGEAIELDGATLRTLSGFVPDMIFVNNDLSSGCPKILCDARQPVFPPPGMGWYRRRKSVHFTAYNQVANEFARAFALDPWLFSTTIHHCGKINFKERKGLECVAIGVDKTIHAIRKKYEEYGIARDPYVYVKADSGTYGMGIMTVKSGEEVFEMNKKTRNKMNVIKEGVHNTDVIIQEGVPTTDMVDGQIAEPVVYLVGGEPVGKVWRINEGRDEETNLNASGMRFDPFSEEAFTQQAGLGLIGRLATVAAAYEHYEHEACNEDAGQASA